MIPPRKYEMPRSPNLQVIINHVMAQDYYQGVYHLGVYNCRPISGSQTYSQHSWPNAVDIHVTDGTWKATPAEKAVGDAIYADLVATFGEHLYENIWWSSSHWNHLHVSAYPKGWLTPPCAGGDLRIKYRDGTVQYVDEFPLTIIKEDDMAKLSEEAQEFYEAAYQRLQDLDPPTNSSMLYYVVQHLRAGTGIVDSHARALANRALSVLQAIKDSI